MASANIRDWSKTRDRILATIPDAHNRAKIRDYLDEREANGKKDGTLAGEANALRDLCVFLGDKPLESLDRKSINAFVNNRQRTRLWRSADVMGRETLTRREVTLSASTMSVRKVIVKSFMKWLRDTEDYPPEVRHLRANRPRADFIPADELVTKEDLTAMLQVHPDRRDKAIIALLYESGFRAGELCALRVGSVEFTPRGVRLTLPKGAPGLKTGARGILVWDCGPLLRDYWENHPRKHQRDAALFYSMSRRAPHAPMNISALHALIKRATARAGITKNFHPHTFRHAAATERARLGWSEAMMRAFFGWQRGSAMPGLYNHAAQSDYEQIEMQRRGIAGPGEAPAPALGPLKCAGCATFNPMTASFCQSCSRPISPAAEAEVAGLRRTELKEMVARMIAEQLGQAKAS